MDKYEFNIKVEQIKKLVNKGDYETAMKIADSIDWRRVRNANLLSMVAEVYEKNEEYQEAKDILLIAFERAPIGKRLLFKLTELALNEGSMEEAEAYYREFCDLAPDDSRQHLLRYLILSRKNAPVEQLIHSLESFTMEELDEKWLYELASLYHEAGDGERCVSLCDKIMLMFGLGKYVDKAMELKLQHAPLTKYQMDLVENRDKYEAKLREVQQGYLPGEEENTDGEDSYEDDSYERESGPIQIEDEDAQYYGRQGGNEYVSYQTASTRQPEEAAQAAYRQDYDVQAEYQAEPEYEAEAMYQTGAGYRTDAAYEPEPEYDTGASYQAGAVNPAEYVDDADYQANAAYQAVPGSRIDASYEPEPEYEDDQDYETEAAYRPDSTQRQDTIFQMDQMYQSEQRYQDDSDYDSDLDPLPATGDRQDYVVAVKQAEVEEHLAEQMSRISFEDVPEDNPNGRTRILGDLKSIKLAAPPEPAVESADIATAPAEAPRTARPEVLRTDRPSSAEFKTVQERSSRPASAAGSGFLLIQARTPEKGIEQAVETLKTLQSTSGIKNPVAKITGSKLNKKGMAASAEKLNGKDLIIEEAGDLSPETIAELEAFLAQGKGGTRVILVDNPKQISMMRDKYPALSQRAYETSRKSESVRSVPITEDEPPVTINVAEEPPADNRPVRHVTPTREEYQRPLRKPKAVRENEPELLDPAVDEDEMDIDEFAQYACKYATEIDCSITGKSMLALYERIEIMEEDGIALTKSSAEELIEEAADRAEKPSLGKLITGVFSSKYDKDGLLILKEEHFI